jgi:tetratricopeptide (TPR) repeat protein
MTLRFWPGFRFIAVFFAINLSFIGACFAGDPQWVEVHSPHFSVITDTGEKRGREVALKFEQMRAVFGALLTKAKVNLPVPLQIIAFRSTKELRQFAPLWHGKPISLAGLFQSGEDRSFILLDMSAPDAFVVVFHEYAHQLMNGNITAETQPWFEEGFAEYFSTIEMDSKVAKVGLKAPPGDWEILQQNSWLHIPDLFAVRHDSQTYNEGDHRSVFYAESWLVVHYLYDTQQIPKLANYFSAVLGHNVPVTEAIQQAFGMSAGQFEKVLRNYMSSGRVRYYPIPLSEANETSSYIVTPISLLDARVAMADMHFHSIDYQEKAVEEFQQILKEQPDNAGALRGLGYAYLRKKDFARAQEYFRKAAGRDSKDPRVHYYSAVLLNEEEAFAPDAEKIAFMKKELQASISLDPTFADAYSLLAFAQSSSGEHEQALTTLKKALELNPRNEAYQFNLALMYLSNQNLDDGIAILTTLQRSSAPEIASRAAESLQQAQAVKAAMQAHSVPAGSQAFIPVSASDSADPDQKMHTATHPQVIPAVAPASGTTKFMKGKLLSVDCSSPPTAFIRVAAGVKTWKLKVADTQHAIVIGADNFSCSWSNQAVALNYRESGDDEGSIVSIELQ